MYFKHNKPQSDITQLNSKVLCQFYFQVQNKYIVFVLNIQIQFKNAFQVNKIPINFNI